MLINRLKNDGVEEIKLNSIQRESRLVVHEKIEQNIYKLEQISCPICRSRDGDVIGEKDRYGLPFVTKLCSGCGLVYTNPRMDQQSYNEFYQEEYRRLYVGKELPTSQFFESQRRKGKNIYSFLVEHQLIDSTPINVLEVGCGAGGILDYFAEKGHHVFGLDIGSAYVEYGVKHHGLNLRSGVLADTEVNFEPDLVIYSHVLEHILDPTNELKLIKSIIKNNSLIYIEVPGLKEIHKNYEGNILKYFQNAHVYHFTLESLTNLMSTNQFERIVGDQYVRSVFVHKKKIFEKVNDYQNTKDYILKTERKRKAHEFGKSGIRKKLIRLKRKLQKRI